jgi:hypothetical protein
MTRKWALVAAVTALAACSQGTGDKSTHEALSTALSTAASSGAEVNLPTTVPGDWTRVLFLCPYGTEEEVNKRLGFAWKDLPGPDDSEGQATFVFATDSEVVAWATLGRSLGDPCSGATPLRTTERKSAVFRLARTDTSTDGSPFYSLLPRLNRGT